MSRSRKRKTKDKVAPEPSQPPANLLDADLVSCPIMQAPMRHPMLASDRYHYELSALYGLFHSKHAQSGQPPISPIRRELHITHAIYDKGLKSTLDLHHFEDRHEDYEPGKMLEFFDSLCSQPQDCNDGLTSERSPTLAEESRNCMIGISILYLLFEHFGTINHFHRLLFFLGELFLGGIYLLGSQDRHAAPRLGR